MANGSGRNLLMGLVERAESAMEGLLPGNGVRALWALVGFAVAVIITYVGVVRSLLVVIMLVIIVAVGQYLMGDPKIINAVRGFFTKGSR